MTFSINNVSFAMSHFVSIVNILIRLFFLWNMCVHRCDVFYAVSVALSFLSERSSRHNKKLERMHRATASTESKLTAISTQLSDVESGLDLYLTALGRLQLIHLRLWLSLYSLLSFCHNGFISWQSFSLWVTEHSSCFIFFNVFSCMLCVLQFLT